MTSSYAAPLNLAARPFQSGGSFPGAPGFGAPGGSTALQGLSFPVSNGSQPGGAGINGFAPSVFRDNRVADWGTNGQVAYHLIVTPDKNNEISSTRLSEIGIGMLCFARDMKLDAFEHITDRQKKPNYGPGHRTERTVEAFELTSLNEYLHSEAKGKWVSDMFETAQQVKEAFPLLGVVLTEVAPANDGNYGNRPSTRVINFVVRGRCQTFNFWSGKRPAGTSVWLIIKKIRQQDNKLVWAFEPWPRPGAVCSPTRNDNYHDAYPPVDEMCWEDDNKVMHVGEALFVGSLGHNVGDVSLDPNRLMWKQGLFKTGNHTMPPTTEVRECCIALGHISHTLTLLSSS